MEKSRKNSNCWLKTYVSKTENYIDVAENIEVLRALFSYWELITCNLFRQVCEEQQWKKSLTNFIIKFNWNIFRDLFMNFFERLLNVVTDSTISSRLKCSTNFWLQYIKFLLVIFEFPLTNPALSLEKQIVEISVYVEFSPSEQVNWNR